MNNSFNRRFDSSNKITVVLIGVILILMGGWFKLSLLVLLGMGALAVCLVSPLLRDRGNVRRNDRGAYYNNRSYYSDSNRGNTRISSLFSRIRSRRNYYRDEQDDYANSYNDYREQGSYRARYDYDEAPERVRKQRRRKADYEDYDEEVSAKQRKRSSRQIHEEDNEGFIRLYPDNYGDVRSTTAHKSLDLFNVTSQGRRYPIASEESLRKALGKEVYKEPRLACARDICVNISMGRYFALVNQYAFPIKYVEYCYANGSKVTLIMTTGATISIKANRVVDEELYKKISSDVQKLFPTVQVLPYSTEESKVQNIRRDLARKMFSEMQDVDFDAFETF